MRRLWLNRQFSSKFPVWRLLNALSTAVTYSFKSYKQLVMFQGRPSAVQNGFSAANRCVVSQFMTSAMERKTVVTRRTRYTVVCYALSLSRMGCWHISLDVYSASLRYARLHTVIFMLSIFYWEHSDNCIYNVKIIISPTSSLPAGASILPKRLGDLLPQWNKVP